MNEWMDEWMNERTNERTNELTNERTNERTNEQMNGWIKEWMKPEHRKQETSHTIAWQAVLLTTTRDHGSMNTRVSVVPKTMYNKMIDLRISPYKCV